MTLTPKKGTERKQEFCHHQQQEELAKPFLAKNQGQRIQKAKSRAKQKKLAMSSPRSTPEKPSDQADMSNRAHWLMGSGLMMKGWWLTSHLC
jgi:hypothetical protein